MNIIKLILLVSISNVVFSDIGMPLTTQQKEDKSLIILDVTISSIALISTDSSRGIIESFHVANLADIIVVKDENKILNFHKIASYRLYFKRVFDPRFMGERVPDFKVGDKARIYLTKNSIQFLHREALLSVSSNNDIEIIKE